MYSSGIPDNSIIEYETALKSDKFVVVVHGNVKELIKAKELLTNMGHIVDVHTI